jgi:hypothetical protein
LCINGFEETVNNQTSEGWGEGVTLRKAVFLEKEVKGAIRFAEVAAVWV